LGRTGRHGVRLSLRRSGGLVCLLLLGLFLTACVSGDAQEQRREETREASEEAVLGDVQATSIAERFKERPASPVPTWTPETGVASLVLASRVNSDGSPQETIRSVSGFSATSVYACAQVSNVREGQKIIAVWSTIDGGEISRTEETLNASANQRWVALRWDTGGAPTGGTYAVSIYIDRIDPEHQLESLAFRVG
jgi:hypothetical protein